MPSPEHWNDHYAAHVITRIPLATVFQSSAALKLLNFLSGQLDWTISKLVPAWVLKSSQVRIKAQLYEWTHKFSRVLGNAAGLCSFPQQRLSPCRSKSATPKGWTWGGQRA